MFKRRFLKGALGSRFYYKHVTGYDRGQVNLARMIKGAGGKQVADGRCAIRASVLNHLMEGYRITALQKQTFNQLTHRRAAVLYNGSYAIKYYHADLDFAFKLDFKNYLLSIIMRLLSVTLVNNSYINTKAVHPSTVEKNKRKSNPAIKLGMLRREFSGIFGIKTVLVNQRRLPKVQFKPGYGRFFRRLRLDYKQTNNLTLTYQKRLTVYLQRFKNLNNMEHMRVSTLSLKLVLVFTHFAPTLALAKQIISSGHVFLNARIIFHENYQLQAGDCLQFYVSYYFYSFFLRQREYRLFLFSKGVNILKKYNKIALLQKKIHH